VSWIVSLRGFREERGKRSVWEGILHSKDPTTFVIVLEDTAALIGIAIAAVGIALASWLEAPAFDAIASILIGVLLLCVGMVLGRETRSLLLGESASRDVVDSVRRIACAQPGVVDVSGPRTMHLGPESVHVDLDVHVADPCDAVDIARRIEAAVTDKHPEIRRVSLRFPA
jgi:divalent metal cation (Fe/Co/Zn/Cd) transporter